MSELAQIAQPSRPISRRSSRLSTALWWIMLVFSLPVVIYAAKYFVLRVTDDHFARYLLPLRLHIAGGMGALLAGPWQFSERLRSRALNLHRWLGRFYLLEVALGSIAGMAMSLGLKRRAAHTFWLRHSCRALVCHGIAGLS